MKRLSEDQSSTRATLRTARAFTRRTVLQGAVATGALAAVGPWVIREGRAGSGSFNFIGWAGYDAFPAVFETFKADTGVTVNFTALPDQDAMFAQVKATGGEGFDLVEPAEDRVPNWVEQGLLRPLDEGKLGLEGVNEGFLGGNTIIDGKRYGSPTVWGTEALCFNTEKAPLEYGKASYGDLWRPEFEGKVTVRPHSSLVGIGLWLEGEGKLPKPMRESFKNEETMIQNYDVIIDVAVKNRKSIGQFWKDENTAQGAFRTNGMVLGQNWDTSAAALIKEGLPISYVAPKEGAISWLQAFIMPKGATNMEQAYEWIRWINSAKGSALWADAYTANPTAKGAEALVNEFTSKFLAMAYPGDALKKIWAWPAQPTWFVTKRTEYADRLQAA